MGVKRVWSTTGVAALTGALLLTSAPVASADYVRDQQWALDVFSVEKVWSESRGKGVTVAVVDTGVDGSHPDLTGQVLPGKDVTGEGDAQKDDADHGTGMASLIAGHGHGANNSSGVMGLAPEAKILPVRISQNGKDGYKEQEWAKGIRYAVDNGASVINLSFGDDRANPSSAAAKAIAYAQQHDVVVVGAAGNEGEGRISYPASLPGVVAVGAVDQSLDTWDKSNFGKEMVLTAPGVKSLSAAPNRSSGYQEADGTSDAAALVSATAALVRAKYPDLSAGQVINRLTKSALVKSDKVPDEEFGYGIIRPYKALTMDIPKGPKQGPLPQAPSSTETKAGNDADGAGKGTDQAKDEDDSSSSTVLVIAGVAAVVVVIGVIFAVVWSRRNRGGGGPGPGGGAPGGGSGYPNQPSYPHPGQHPGAPYGAQGQGQGQGQGPQF